MFGIGRIAAGLRRGPMGAGAAVAGGIGGARRPGLAGALANRMRGGPPVQQAMSATAPSTGLGAGSDMKAPADDRDATEPRTFMRSPMQTMGGRSEYRGQSSSLRSATRRNNRRAGRALSR